MRYADTPTHSSIKRIHYVAVATILVLGWLIQPLIAQAVTIPTAPYAATPTNLIALESHGIDWEIEVQKPQTVEEMVTAEFNDAPVMVAIARAESRFDPKAKNPNSTATGVFQILIGTWNAYHCEGERTDAKANIACARKIYEDSGTVPWNSSSANW